MSSDDEIHLLAEIKAGIDKVNDQLEDLKDILQADRQMMWKLLILVISGAFLLIGVKLVIPS